MDNFLNSLPKSVLVAGALAVGLALIFLLNPPHTKCDSQFEIFQSSQASAKLLSNLNVCKERTNSGSCFRFFEDLKSLLNDIETVSYECRKEILSKPEVSSKLWESLGFIFEIAWGPTGPLNYLDKLNWLDNVHVSIFCDVQALVKESFSEGDWTAFREKTLTSLPGASTMDRKEVWNRSLFTLKCQ